MIARVLLSIAALSATLTACGVATIATSSTPTTITPTTSTIAAGERQVPGIIDYFQQPQHTVVIAPNTITVSTPFEVEISTFGDGCVRSGGADVQVIGLQAEVFVYDYTTRSFQTPCTQELKRLTRTVKVQFAEAGEALIIVHGVRVGPETSSMDGVPATLEQTITIQ